MMRKLTFTLFLLVFSNFCYSQEYDFTIEDVFDFRLGMTVEEVKAVIDTTLFSYIDVDRPVERDNIQIFQLERHSPTDGKELIISDLLLAFEDNKLYAIISLDYNKVLEALLTTIYGEPEEGVIERTKEYEKVETIWDTKINNFVCISSLEGNPKTNELFGYDLTIGCFSKLNRWILDGLYRFELGMSVEKMQSLVDTTQLIEDHTSPSPKTRNFILKEHVVDQETSYTLRNLEFNFYDNQLFQIVVKIYDENTENNLTKLYGMPEETIEKREDGFEECTYNWNTNIKNVFCYSKTMRNPQKKIVTDYKLSIVNYKLFMNSMLDPASIEADMKILDKWREKRKDN